MGDFADERRTLSEPDALKLHEVEDLVMAKLENRIEIVKGYSAHWAIRDNQLQSFWNAVERPTPSTVHIVLDFEE